MLVRYEHRPFETGCEVWIKKYRKLNNLPHWHSEAELITVTRGTAHITVDGKSYPVSEGFCIFAAAGCVHTILLEPESSILVAQFARPGGIRINSLQSEEVLFPDQYRIAERMNAIYAEFRSAGPYMTERVNALSVLLLTDLLSAMPFTESTAHRYGIERFNSMLAYAAAHCEDFDYRAAVQYMYMSEGHFSRYFKARTGTTFTRYMNALRISRAVDLLHRMPSISVTDLAAQCGFNTLRSFNRVFKEMTGYTCTTLPEDYTFHIRSHPTNGIDFDPTLEYLEE
ncbi:MAG: AraC family transcriptional regulator [Eubacteriales bacterium]|nr:AraC family transcriptional regulator [Eubacteriales bacterium]